MKAKFMAVALVMAAMLASCGSKMAKTEIATQADSLNYCIGLNYGANMRVMALGEDTADQKAIDKFIKGFEKVFSVEPGSLDYLKVNGFHSGATLAMEIADGFLFGDSTIKAEKALIVSSFEAGFMDTDFPLKGQKCVEYVQNAIGRSMMTGEPCNPTVGQKDTINMCIGYMNARQARMYIVRNDSTKQSLDAFMKGFRKGIKVKAEDKHMVAGMNFGVRISMDFEQSKYIFEDEAFPLDRMTFGRGIIDGIRNNSADALMTIEDSRMFLDNIQQMEMEKKFGPVKAEGEKFLAENAQREGVVVTASGLQYEVIAEGKGPKPTAEDTVRVNYHGTLIDGTVFDSSVERGKPVDFAVNRVIAGWTEGLQLMSKGAKYKFYIPYNLAYGERGAGEDILPYSTLIFEVELLDFHAPVAPKAAPVAE